MEFNGAAQLMGTKVYLCHISKCRVDGHVYENELSNTTATCKVVIL